MSNGVLETNVITQIGMIVRDVEKNAADIADFFGVEKPTIIITDEVDKAQTVYKGESTEARAKQAFFDMGSLQLELIEPNEHPSTWREFLDQQGEGIHHIAFVVDGMKEKIKVMESKGMPLIQKGEYDGGRYAYLDTFKDLKVLIELLEND